MLRLLLEGCVLSVIEELGGAAALGVQGEGQAAAVVIRDGLLVLAEGVHAEVGGPGRCDRGNVSAVAPVAE